MGERPGQARPEKAEQHIYSLSSVSLEDLQSESWNVAQLLTRVGHTHLPASSSKQPGQLSMTVLKQLLERYERCDKELAKLQQQVDLKAERLRREAAADEGAYEARLGATKTSWEAARSTFQDLERRMNGVTQTATKVGNRLASADRYRRRALEAIERISCLQEFAYAKEPTDLPPMFHDDSQLSEAAAMTGKLLALASELVSSRARAVASGQADASHSTSRTGSSSGPPHLGSTEHALEQVELYRNLVDNRVVSRFDAALTRQDLRAMAECASIMAQFPRGEAVLVQRYISTRPIFKTWEGKVGAAGAAGGVGSGINNAGASGRPAVQPEAAGDAATALKGLSALYKSIAGTMRDEAVVMEQVFPAPYTALGALIQRVYEQKVQTAVDAVLRCAPRGPGPDSLHGHLRLLADVYRKTRALAEELQELVGGEVAVAELADMVLAGPLSDYLGTEQQWLSMLYEAKITAHRAALAQAQAPQQQHVQHQAQQQVPGATGLAHQPGASLSLQGGQQQQQQQQQTAQGQRGPTPAPVPPAAAATASAAGLASMPGGEELSMALVLDLLAMNEEAVGRCVLLSAPGQVAPSVRQLFHSSTRRAANTGCLLEQVASHLMQGLGAAVDACVRALLAPFRPAQPHAASSTPVHSPAGAAPGVAAGGSCEAPWQLPPRTELERAATAAACAGVGRVLCAVTAAGAMVKAVQQHHARVVAPAVAAHSVEARACMTGLAALVRAVDERVLAALQRAITLFFNQVDLTLVAAQRRSDFLPPESAPPSLDAPTPACSVIVALLGAVAIETGRHLHGPNLTSFRAELGRRLHRALSEHMLRHTYSPMGGLRWRRDLAEYAGAAANLGAPTAAAAIEELAGLSNLLVVAPASLSGLADGNLRLSRRAALAYVSLREDFHTARVGDQTLAALFAGGAEAGMSG